jgi:hypothetical protein
MPVRTLRDLTLEGLLTRLSDRLRRLETRTTTVVGTGANTYVLEVNAAGQLTARNATTGTVTVIAVP